MPAAGEPDRPLIQVDPRTFICAPHQWDQWRVYAGKVPNAIGVMLLLVRHLTADPKVVAMAGWVDGEQEADLAALTGVLRELGCAACYVGEDRYQALLVEAAGAMGVGADRIFCTCGDSYAAHSPYIGQGLAWGQCFACDRCAPAFQPRDREVA